MVWAARPVLTCHLFLIAVLASTPSRGFAQQGLTSSGNHGQIPATAPAATDHVFTISGRDWTDTGIALAPGDALQIAVENSSASPTASECRTSGSTVSTAPLRIESAPPGSVVARLAANAQPFPINGSRTISIVDAGHLYLAENEVDACQNGKSVKVHVGPSTTAMVKNKLSNAAQIWLSGQFGNAAASSSTPSGSSVNGSGPGVAEASAALKVSSQPLDSQLRHEIDRAPRRVNDQFNHPGDMVNFVIIGSQQQVEQALAAGNWHLADTSNADAITKAIEMTRQNKDYLQMPMSLLYLFGRVQDFGYEQAEPYAVVASRHHFRLWKAPFTYKGEPVWLGAGTHDIGFEKDQRNGSVTHKIDPNVDLERQNIGQSLEKYGRVESAVEYLPPDPVQSARNATGGGYQSDGKILVITLK